MLCKHRQSAKSRPVYVIHCSLQPHTEGRSRPFPRCQQQELACSLAASNPAVQLVVLAVRGELASATVKAVEAVAIMRYAEPVFFESLSSTRCALVASTQIHFQGHLLQAHGRMQCCRQAHYQPFETQQAL